MSSLNNWLSIKRKQFKIAEAILEGKVPTSCLSVIYATKLRRYNFENRDVVEFIERQISRNHYSSFIDVGANVGAISSRIARQIDKCIAIEPSIELE